MKNNIKRIFAFALATMLLINPFTAPTASATRIIRSESDSISKTLYFYEKDPLMIPQGETRALINDTNDGRWFVKANQSISFYFESMYPANFSYSIVRVSDGKTVFSGSFDGFDYDFPLYQSSDCSIDKTDNYVILVTPSFSTLMITKLRVQIQ